MKGGRTNTFDGERVRWSAAQIVAYRDLLAYYETWFVRGT